MASLKKFETLELIAKGGMAEVYRARAVGAEGFAKDVCIKKILPHLTQDEQFVSMFVNEAKLAATLSFANIVEVHDLCVSDDREYYIVMEYVAGKDVSDIIRASQLAGKEIPPPLAVYIARETLKGLHYAHTKTDHEGAPLNVIHRDVSPQNVLVSFAGEVKLTDFGIAKASSSMNKTAVGILKGKYGYMSPEQARGEPLDARSDLFCLGIVLYEMLVGERCFAGASDYSTLNLMREAVVTPPTKINKQVPAALEAIVLKALAKDPRARYQDGLEFEAALAKFAIDQKMEARAPDVARYLKGLFTGGEAKKSGEPTGVLAMSSIASPPARPPPAETEKKPKKERPSKAPAPAEHPTEEAQVVKMPAEAPPPEAPPAEAKNGEVKREKKPARLKPGPEEGGEKVSAKDAKKKAAENKRPIAKKDLRPGISKLMADARGPSRRRNLGIAVGLTVIAGVVGALIGLRQTGAMAEQATLRELELQDRPGGASEKTATLWITSDPPGATVWLDKSKLASVTPLAVERPHDAEEHEIELGISGMSSVKRKLRYEPGPVTRVFEPLRGGSGELVVRTKPSNLHVSVDGKHVGESPLSVDVSAGGHSVELSGEGVETISAAIEVGAGQKATLDRTVPKKGTRTTAAFITEPPAQILVEGRSIGKLADGAPIPMAPGARQKVTLVDPARGKKRDIFVELAEGEAKVFVIEMDPRGN
ncbi:MAG: serine/threonine-protein kinase [Myxococcota bacterium]